jgi:hypothetical protein
MYILLHNVTYVRHLCYFSANSFLIIDMWEHFFLQNVNKFLCIRLFWLSIEWDLNYKHQFDSCSRYPQYHNCHSVSEYKHHDINIWYSRLVFCFSFCFSTRFCSTWCFVLDQIIPDLNPFWPKIVFFLTKVFVSSSVKTYLGSITKDLWIIKGTAIKGFFMFNLSRTLVLCIDDINHVREMSRRSWQRRVRERDDRRAFGLATPRLKVPLSCPSPLCVQS